MPILSDCHIHTMHSGVSKTPMEEMILQGISQGLTTMCFTEHNDFRFPVTELDRKENLSVTQNYTSRNFWNANI